jgi:Glycosyl hydrolase family 12
MLLSAGITGGSATAQDVPVTSTACGLAQRIDQRAGKTWVISRPNPFDTSGQQLCIHGNTSRPGFQIMTNLRRTGAWQAYPFTGVGCAYRLCTPGTDLPKQVRRVPRWANTSFAWHGPAPGRWNASYDIWFDHHDQTSAQNNGAELMIWLRPNPGYRGGVIVHVGRRRYWFMHWRACDRGGPCWNYTQFRFTRVVHSVWRLRLKPFIHFLERRHLVSRSWWLTSVHAGYELVEGGKGLTTTWFNAHI